MTSSTAAAWGGTKAIRGAHNPHMEAMMQGNMNGYLADRIDGLHRDIIRAADRASAVMTSSERQAIEATLLQARALTCLAEALHALSRGEKV